MENARIAVFEDKSDLRLLLRHLAELTGHTIVGEAANMDQAHDVIANSEFDVAVVDGNLEDASDISCKDGKAVAEAIRARRQGATIIWFSSVRMPKAEVDYDFDTGKDIVSVIDVIEAI